MSSRPGNPVTVATHLIGAVTRRSLALTGRVALTGLSTGLSLLEGSRRAQQTTKRYADTAVQLASTTPLGRFIPTEADEDADSAATEAAAEAERIVSAVSNGGREARQPAAPTTTPTPAGKTTPATPAAKTTPATPARKSGNQSPPPREPAGHTEAAREVGAPGAASEQAEAAVAAAVDADDLPTDPSRDELPIENYDSVSLPSLRARLRSLSLDDLALLREYEQSHAHRLPVVTMLDNRIAKLATESGGGDAGGTAA